MFLQAFNQQIFVLDSFIAFRLLNATIPFRMKILLSKWLIFRGLMLYSSILLRSLLMTCHLRAPLLSLNRRLMLA